jgi:hypothetical protein
MSVEESVDARAVLAREVMKSDPHTRTFLVSETFLEDYDGDWSEPVQFRFEMTDAGVLDLVIRTVT